MAKTCGPIWCGVFSVKHLLFVCGANKLRSPTAEQIFSGYRDFETDSAGLNADAHQRVSTEQIAWADIIFVMEKSQRGKLARQFRKYLNGKRVVCLDIPDKFAFMQPELVALLERKVRPLLPK
jgi:predicted protein tyrosine phosphatase